MSFGRTTNPFDAEREPDRHSIWNMLVARDSDAFALGDWSMVEPDFDADIFEGIRCFHSSDPDVWRIVFPDLASYRDSWLAASEEFRARRFLELSTREAIYARTRLDRIDIAGERALAHKKFAGELRLEDGSVLGGNRQTLFRLRRVHGSWKISGFLGQLPYEPPARMAQV